MQIQTQALPTEDLVRTVAEELQLYADEEQECLDIASQEFSWLAQDIIEQEPLHIVTDYDEVTGELGPLQVHWFGIELALDQKTANAYSLDILSGIEV